MNSRRRFYGAKVMLFAGDDLLVLRRDFAPGLAWPGMLDFPGGVAEGDEDPVACVLREIREELGLTLDPDLLRWVHLRDAGGRRSWFFAAHGPAGLVDEVRFGGEGLEWAAIPPMDFVNAPDAVWPFRGILASYLASEKKKPGRA